EELSDHVVLERAGADGGRLGTVAAWMAPLASIRRRGTAAVRSPGGRDHVPAPGAPDETGEQEPIAASCRPAAAAGLGCIPQIERNDRRVRVLLDVVAAPRLALVDRVGEESADGRG